MPGIRAFDSRNPTASGPFQFPSSHLRSAAPNVNGRPDSHDNDKVT